MTDIFNRMKRDLLGDRFFNRTPVVIVAVSTGVDSMVLLTMLQKMGTACPRIVVAHVNHELRDQSREEESFLKDYCRQHHLVCEVRHWPRGEHPQHGIEAAGRHIRYHFFAELMKKYGASVVMTAHHANDQAETILMKLTRGGELDQMLGLRYRRPFASGYLIRPLLNITKAELRNYAEHHQIKWYEDATNADLTIQRNRYRHKILPALQRENPQVIEHLGQFHSQLSLLMQFRDEQVGRLLKECTCEKGLQLGNYLKLSGSAQQLVLLAWLKQMGIVDLKEGLVTEITRLIRNDGKPQARLSLPVGRVLVKDYSHLMVVVADKPEKRTQQREGAVVKLGQWFSTRKGQVAVSPGVQPGENTELVAKMWLRDSQFPLRLRIWHSGDRLRLRSGHHQRVNRILIDEHVPLKERARQLVLVDSHGAVLWVIGRKTAWYDYPSAGTVGGHNYFLVRRSNKREDQRQNE
ncbi:tRNA lysidine(34) synthetase TilS [Limosilactobacillus sp.]|uniref:tRNA lysidine(34) synthetase TilS n=1 Tax=Limosilactobacillus sp. TaxID=2773925 RepID=UPI00345E628F